MSGLGSSDPSCGTVKSSCAPYSVAAKSVPWPNESRVKRHPAPALPLPALDQARSDKADASSASGQGRLPAHGTAGYFGARWSSCCRRPGGALSRGEGCVSLAGCMQDVIQTVRPWYMDLFTEPWDPNQAGARLKHGCTVSIQVLWVDFRASGL